MKKKEKKYFGKLPGTDIYKCEEGERLINSLRPNKFKFIFPYVFWFSLLGFFVGGFLITCGILCMLNLLLTRQPENFKYGILMFLAGVFILAFSISSVVLRVFRYKNSYYYITNKRVIITHGLEHNIASSINLEFIVDIILYSNILDRIGKNKTCSLILKCKRIEKNEQLIFIMRHLIEAKKAQNDIINLKNVLELEKLENNKK